MDAIRETEKLKLVDENDVSKEEMYHFLIQDTNDLIAVLNENFEHEFINEPAYLKVLGYSEEDLIGKHPQDFTHPEDIPRVATAIKKGIKNGDVSEKFRIKHKMGHYVWLETKAKLFKTNNGKFKFIFISKDLTESIQIRDSEAAYRLITENANDLIRVLNKDFDIEFINEVAHKKVLGYSKDELLKKKDIFFNHPDDYRSIGKFMMKVFKTGEGFHESRLKHKNGNYIWFEVKIKCFKDDQNQQKYLLIYRDINERKKTEEKLKESEEMYRNLYENSPVAIVLTDEEGFILEQNEASQKIFGFQDMEIYGKNFEDFDVFTPEQIHFIKESYSNSLKGIKLRPIELMIKKKDGNRAWINFQLSIIKQNDLNLIEVIAHDITEEKKAKMVIEKENEKLLELNKIKTELVSRVSHELKTPLNSVYGATQILLNLHKNEINDNILEFIKIIHKGGARLKKLIENLLDISRIESNKLKLNIKKHNISEIIKECVEDFKYFANERNIQVSLELLDNINCEIDKFRIEQVITNLLSNAIKNTPPKGSIKVTLSRNEDAIYISVQDSGVGLTLGEMDKLFIKFGKIERYGQRMNVDIEGTGLGLFITKEIVDLHNGSIWVASEGKNKGARFTVRLNQYFE